MVEMSSASAGLSSWAMEDVLSTVFEKMPVFSRRFGDNALQNVQNAPESTNFRESRIILPK